MTTNTDLICAGTNEDVIFWDVRAVTKPIGKFTESHNDEVTQVCFNEAGNLLLSCSLDNVLNIFDLTLNS